MPSVHSLKSIVISKFYPDQMEEVITIMEKRGYDFKTIIDMNLQLHNITVEKIVNFNRDYDGWWGAPYRIAAFTTNPELHSKYQD